MDSISLAPNFQLAGAGGSNFNMPYGRTGAPVTINDYGNKILSGVDDIQDYGKELGWLVLKMQREGDYNCMD